MEKRAQAYGRGITHSPRGRGRPRAPSLDQHSTRASRSVEKQRLLEWKCAESTCRFTNIGRMEVCLSCGKPKPVVTKAFLRSEGYPTQYDSQWQSQWQSQFQSQQSRSGSKPLGWQSEAKALALLPLADTEARMARDSSTRVSPRPVIYAPAFLCTVPAAQFEPLVMLLGAGGASRQMGGVYVVRYATPSKMGAAKGSDAGEVGVVQGPCPLGPGESFKVTLVARGTFGQVGIGLAPLRQLGGSAAAGAGEAEQLEVGAATMIGSTIEETGYHGDHGRWWYGGRNKIVSPPWSLEDIIECGLTSRGHAFFARNGVVVAEAAGFWPTEHAYPTVTLRSAGAELAVCLQDVAEKSLPGATKFRGTAKSDPFSLLARFKSANLSGSGKREGVGLTWIERWFSRCSDVVPAACCKLEVP